jgi:hypothetical protein
MLEQHLIVLCVSWYRISPDKIEVKYLSLTIFLTMLINKQYEYWEKKRLYRLFDCKDSSEIQTKGYENALLLVTQAIDTIMTGEGLDDNDLVISSLLRQDILKYKSLFPHVSAAIQSRKYPLKGDTIHIFTQIHNITTLFIE